MTAVKLVLAQAQTPWPTLLPQLVPSQAPTLVSTLVPSRMPKPAPRLVATLAAALLFLLSAPGVSAQSADTQQATDIAAGERLYRLGIRPDGSLLQATRAQVGGVVSGAAGACVACHRRSGMGMQEGRLLAPPVAGAILFKPGAPYRPARAGAPSGARRSASAPAITQQAARHLARSAYDVASLTRALTEGVDPNGRPLDVLMPRYALNQAEVAQLAAYLNQLDPQQASGLDEPGLIHLATVITPDAPARRRAVVVETLQHWADAVALRGRRVRLQVWQLEGAASTWRAQLDRLQQQRPVYAVVSGAGRANWAPVQAFCEARQLPCILPLIDLAPDTLDAATTAAASTASTGSTPSATAATPAVPSATAADEPYYSLYFSAGVDAEAQLAARYLMAQPAATAATSPAGLPALLQVSAPGDPLGAAAARRFAATWTEAASLTTLELDAHAPDAGERLLHALSLTLAPAAGPITTGAGKAGTGLTTGAGSHAAQHRLMLWVDPAQLQAWVARFPAGIPGVASVLVSAQLSPAQALDLPPAWQRQIAWASLKSDPTRLRAGQAMVLSTWLTHLGLAAQPGSEQTEVYAAAFFVGDALARMRLGWSQTWLMEQLETVVNNRPAGAAYYSLSLGPGQRVAAKVGRVLAIEPASGTAQALPWQDRLAPVSELIRADD